MHDRTEKYTINICKQLYELVVSQQVESDYEWSDMLSNYCGSTSELISQLK